MKVMSEADRHARLRAIRLERAAATPAQRKQLDAEAVRLTGGATITALHEIDAALEEKP